MSRDIRSFFTPHLPATKDEVPSGDEKVRRELFHPTVMSNRKPTNGSSSASKAINEKAQEPSKIPQAAEKCLANLSFLITGILQSLQHEEAKEIIEQYGGKVVYTVSKTLSYMIVGQDPGPSKLSKAESIGVRLLSEGGFFDLLSSNPPVNDVEQSRTSSADNNTLARDEAMSDGHYSPDRKRMKQCNPELSLADKPNSQEEVSTADKAESLQDQPMAVDDEKLQDVVDRRTALVEKYRPTEMKKIIGQAGDDCIANKLRNWLINWHNSGHGKKTAAQKPTTSSGDDSGGIYRAALLSGPPGIGKTTTAHVVCAQLGYQVVEFNASDTRSKKLLNAEVEGILSNKTLRSFLEQTSEKHKDPPKHVLLMDEVDGMAGNEDRGGMQELVSLIKSTLIPIICICNDRQSPKIKTLANHTFDLRFQKPLLKNIRGPMRTICFREGIDIDANELDSIISSSDQDIRQVINHIAVLRVDSKKLRNAGASNETIMCKDAKLGPWDVVRKVFSAKEHKSMSIHDKSELFFHDYGIAPLYVQENYLGVRPSGPKNLLLDKIADCSESLAIGDVIEQNIRSNQSWCLLSLQACFSSVIPGTIMSGSVESRLRFPSWLGNNSKTNKFYRLLGDVADHARPTTAASREAINLDYIKLLADSLVRPLARDGEAGVDAAMDVMNRYHLTREDRDSLMELTKWPHTRDPMQSIDAKTKSAFTKAYNQSASVAGGSTTKKKAPRAAGDDEYGDSDGEASDSNVDYETIENDKLVKAKAFKKPTKGHSASTSKKTRARTKKPATRTKK